MSKEPAFEVVPATKPDRTPMKYEVITPTDVSGDPEGATPVEKAAATRTAKALQADTPKEN